LYCLLATGKFTGWFDLLVSNGSDAASHRTVQSFGEGNDFIVAVMGVKADPQPFSAF
jgi:hypothetical protein